VNRFLLAALLASGCAAHKEMLALEGNGKALRNELARMFVNKGSYVAAMPYLQTAIREDPKNVEMATLLGVVLRENGLYPQAEEQFRRALELDRSHAPAWAGLGMLYDLEKRSADAEEAHRKALELDATNANEWNNLGFSLYVAGKTDEAIAALEKALALSPGLVVAYNNLGFAYARKGDHDGARRCFLAVGGEKGARANLKLASKLTVPSDEEEPFPHSAREALP
jgi:Flp pilus assembly protein TadD